MALLLKKNTAGQYVYFMLLLSGTSPSTGLTVLCKRSIDGGASATATGSIVEDGDGIYHLITSAADTNGTDIVFLFTGVAVTRTPMMVQCTTLGRIWDEPTASHTVTGSLGKAVGDAAGGVTPNTIAATVWNYLTSAISTTGSIGKLLKDQLDVTVGSRLSEADYTGAANGDIAAIKAKTDNLPGSPAATSDIPSVSAIADGLLDRADAIETSWTPRQALRIIFAALAGKVSGAATANVLIRDASDTKNRINATVDANGNRTAVTYDKS